MYFGQDWPSTLKKAAGRKAILTAFNLDSADWLFDKHETRLEADERAFSALTKCNAISGGRGRTGRGESF